MRNSSKTTVSPNNYRTSAESMEPGYLARRFAAIRKRQAAARVQATTDAVVRNLREPKAAVR